MQLDRELFTRTLAQLADELLIRLHSPWRPNANNDELLCLTWAFAACPASIRQEVQTAFRNGTHRFLIPVAGALVVAHGLGRVTNDTARLSDLVPILLDQLPRSTVLPLLASMISRPDATPAILAKVDVENAADRMNGVFSELVARVPFKATYKYAQLVLAGLLRVREHQPWALTTARSASARTLAATLERASARLQHSSFKRQLASTLGLLQYLATNEGRPDLLMLIDLDQ